MTRIDCRKCAGQGEREEVCLACLGTSQFEHEDCQCDGTGTVLTACEACDGVGHVEFKHEEAAHIITKMKVNDLTARVAVLEDALRRIEAKTDPASFSAGINTLEYIDARDYCYEQAREALEGGE